MTPVYHITGCGQVAFWFRFPPDDAMPLDPNLVVYEGGESPPDKSKAICGSCYEDLEVTDLTLKDPNKGQLRRVD